MADDIWLTDALDNNNNNNNGEHPGYEENGANLQIITKSFAF